MMDYRNNYNNENETNNENMMAAEQNSFNGKKPSSKNKKAAKLAKKIGAIALSAVLFGGVAGGTFQAVNHFAGSTTATATTTTAQQTTSNSSLLKAAATSSSSTSTGTMDVSTIAKNAMPSIVSITNQSVQEVQNYFSMFGYGAQTPQTEETTSCGSGIIIGKNDTELLIVTNNHVVEDADTLSVSFVNNQVCKANIKGTDADNDLAVIAVPLSEIPDDTMSSIAVATMGDSDSVEVGEQVVAIGNALGYGQSVTTGIISAANRVIDSDSSSDGSSDGTTADTSSTDTTGKTYLQTDAAINPGNSGGALALAVADRVLMLEHSVYAILSPEGFASILWKDAGRSGEAANLMKLTAPELLRLRVIDEVILEPAGGAHLAPAIAYREVDQALFRHLSALSRERGSVLTAARYEKFRRMGVVLPNEDAPRKEEP